MSTITSALDSIATTATTTSEEGLSQINSSDFMNILIKQLQYQDPFEPMSNAEMVQQMSTIRELEMNTRLSNKLEQLTEQQRFGSAAALIGKYASGTVTDADGNEYARQGVVTGVSFTENGDVMLELDSGEILPLTGLEQVTNVTTDDGSSTSSTTETNGTTGTTTTDTTTSA